MTVEITTTAERLRNLEATVRAGMGAVLAVGAALREIKDDKLYLQTHDNWDDYCRETFRFGGKRGYQMIKMHTVVEQLPPNLSTRVDNERTARALARVPAARRAEVIELAARDGDVTPRSIAQAAVVTDSEGYPLPEPLVPFFRRASEVTDLQSHIAVVGRALKAASEQGDMLFAEVNVTGLVSDLRSISLQLSCAIPFAVCYQCQGVKPKNCPACRGRGFISKRLIATVPEEIRKIRAKGVKK